MTKNNAIKYLTKKILHSFIVPFFKSPYINKYHIGFSLVRSQRINVSLTNKSEYSAPYIMRNVQIGDYTYIRPNSNINNTCIGKFCSIGPNFCCGLGIHPTNGISTSPFFYSVKENSFAKETIFIEEKNVIIGNDVHIGINVTILDGISIGNGAILGAGAVITKDIPPYAIVAGVPATIIRYRFNEETIKQLEKIKWWNLQDKQLMDVYNYFFDVDHFILKYNTQD